VPCSLYVSQLHVRCGPVGYGLVRCGLGACGPGLAACAGPAELALPTRPALAIGQGSAIQQPLAISIIAELVPQFPLVLLVMPVLISFTIKDLAKDKIQPTEDGASRT
jgi:hypothetical protein